MKLLNSVRNTSLQSVLQRSRTQDDEVLLDELAGFLHLLIPIANGTRRRVVRPRPVKVLLLVKVSVADEKRSKTGVGHGLEIGLSRGDHLLVVVVAQASHDDRVGTLGEHDEATLGAAGDDTHPLSGTVELEHAKRRPAFSLTEDLDIEMVVVLVEEGEAGISSRCDQGGLCEERSDVTSALKSFWSIKENVPSGDSAL